MDARSVAPPPHRLPARGRRRAESYKVRAFRRAAATVDEVDPAVLAPAAPRSGRLTDLPGVGDTTARVIAEALAGDDTGLSPCNSRSSAGRRPTGPRRRAARPAARRLPQPFGLVRRRAAPSPRWPRPRPALGHEYLALTDHSPRLTVAHGLDPERLLRQLEVVDDVERGAGAVPDPHRHRGRHPRGRRTRPGRRPAGPPRRRRGERALEAQDGARPR